MGDGHWRLSPDQLEGLTIQVPADAPDGDIVLEVAAFSTESKGGAVDGITATLPVTVSCGWDTTYETPDNDDSYTQGHWGDPHFVGDDGGLYDIQGEPGKIYNILSDQSIQYNARFASWGGGGATVVDAIGIRVADSHVFLEAGGTPTVDGEPLTDNEEVALGGGGTVISNGNQLTIQTSEYTLEFDVISGRHGAYINGDYTATDPFADYVGAHGLWGQTVDGDTESRDGDRGAQSQGGGAIDTLDADGNVVRSQRGDRDAVNLYLVDDFFDVEGANSGEFFRFGDERGTGLERL